MHASSAARARSSMTCSCRGCSTARSCAARSRTPGSSRSTPPPRWRTRRSTRSSPAATWRRAGWPGCRRCRTTSQAVLATDKVRFQGQEVAFVVADDRYSARDALELIDVEYEPLPAVVDARRALDPDAAADPRRPGRADATTTSSIGSRATASATDRVFALADVVVEQEMRLPALASGADGDLWRGRRVSTVSAAS